MDLSTRYLGMHLKNPLVPSASPLSRSLDSARRLEDAGAAAIIMYSLFAEAVDTESEAMERFLRSPYPPPRGTLSAEPQDFPGNLDRYLEQISSLKASLSIPVIASLNGVTLGGWVNHARELQDAGADALELNAYFIAANIEEPGSAVERRYLEILAELKKQLSIPINMKLSPMFSSIANMVKHIEDGGADGVSLFNRFLQPDIDITTLRLVPALHYSTPEDSLLPMHWISILFARTELSLGATGGVHGFEEAAKLLLAGADVVHLCSSLLENGPEHLGTVLADLEGWMEKQEFDDIDLVRGRMSELAVADPAAFERAGYINLLDKNSYPDR
ncbi:MAG: dihydroorotate dehydrogenase-like protein [Pseudomonadota bacterium]